MTAKLRSIGVELRKRRHKPIAETGDWLKQVVRGYFNYHEVPGNLPRLETFRQQIARTLAIRAGAAQSAQPVDVEAVRDSYRPLSAPT
jgi:hypothetical protein